MTGTGLIVTVDGVALGHTTNFTIDIQHATSETSDRSSAGWVELLSSRRSCTINFEGYVDYADDTAVDAIGFHNLVADGIIGRQEFTLVFGTSESLDEILTVSAFLTSVSSTSPDEEVVTYSGTFTSTGAIVQSANV